ncbi:MAG: DUF4167 domain-containing protein [Rhodospirillales bacterium]|jgi:hypothetical protein|nr:DUF4167 domain-containing protein [Rhodospirillales bacterium]
MKHTTNPRRGRNRGNGRRHPQSLKTQTFESSGPDGKIRGTAQQVLDRYLVLGRDAASAGDPVAAEGFYQFAEHYYRIISAAEKASGERTLERPRRPGGDDAPGDDGVAEVAGGDASAEAPEPVQV